MSRIYLSMVIACYNEEEHLQKSFPQLLRVLRNLRKPFEIIFVEDSSKDSTLSIIKEILKKNLKIDISVIEHKKNTGRGKSVADGIKKSRGEIVGFMDIDLEISPSYIPGALRLIKKTDVVVGQRTYISSFNSIHRYIASKTYVALRQFMLKLPIKDTEAGFKFFKREKIIPILKYAKNSGWFWDTEIVFFAERYGLKIIGMPVRFIRRRDKTSTVNYIPDSINYLANLISLYIRISNRR